MADLFALERIHGDILFRNDDYIAPEKVGGGWVGGWTLCACYVGWDCGRVAVVQLEGCAGAAAGVVAAI